MQFKELLTYFNSRNNKELVDKIAYGNVNTCVDDELYLSKILRCIIFFIYLLDNPSFIENLTKHIVNK